MNGQLLILPCFPAGHHVATNPSLSFTTSLFMLPPLHLPRQPLIRLPIPPRRPLRHLPRHLHALLPLELILRKPVPQVLLIQTVLRPPHLVLLLVPEPAAVRREHLVDQDDRGRRCRLVERELELGVCDYDTPL